MYSTGHKNDRPEMTDEVLSVTHKVAALDQLGRKREVFIASELPLTIKVDGLEVVTLMTLGSHPKELALGYLRNQRLMNDLEEIKSITVDWPNEMVNITTFKGKGVIDIEKQSTTRIVTTGCGQGTIFSCTLDALYDVKLSKITVRQSTLFLILKEIFKHNLIYKTAGSVHGCGLFRGAEILMFIEDVSRNNAADIISGWMWIEDIPGDDKILYTTGRLTSEIVMKAANMKIPVLLSRSGISHMALELSQDLGMTMIGRAKGNRFLVFTGEENIVFDSVLNFGES